MRRYFFVREFMSFNLIDGLYGESLLFLDIIYSYLSISYEEIMRIFLNLEIMYV